MEKHLELPDGYVALRFVRDVAHFDIALPKDAADALAETMPEAITDAGYALKGELDISELGEIVEPRIERPVVSIGDSIRDLMKSIPRLEKPRVAVDYDQLEIRPIPVPHRKRFEYADRPLLDMGPVPRPRGPSRSPGRTKDWVGKSSAEKKRKRKQRQKSQRKNRR